MTPKFVRLLGLLVLCFSQLRGLGQIDPVKRDLVQIGYNAALQGHQPVSAYAFYYRNRPGFLQTNLTLRLAIAPTYLDSELGFSRLLGPNTDFAIGVAGGGFADSYAEIDNGVYEEQQSFFGHGAELSARVYHLFNPDQRIPLHGVIRTGARYSAYTRSKNTDDNFELPDNRTTANLRTGLRLGGREPTLYPELAMSVSIWYDGQYRSNHGTYGYNDRVIEPDANSFWGEANLVYTLPNKRQCFDVSLSLGTVLTADRFSAYRLGALLPLISEFPLSLPGYYYQELSARNFMLLGGNYLHSLDEHQHWNINITAATALVDYIEGLSQPGNWHTGVGGGMLYRTDSWKFMVGYAYGVDAIRSHGRGAHSIGVLTQFDWGEARKTAFNPTSPNLWRGLQRVFGLFGQ